MAQSSPIPSTSPAVRGKATRRRNFSISSGSFTVSNLLNPGDPNPGTDGTAMDFRQSAPEIHGSLVSPHLAKRCLTVLTPFERIPYAAGPVRPAKLLAVRTGARQTMKQEIGTRWKKVLLNGLTPPRAMDSSSGRAATTYSFTFRSEEQRV